MRRHVPDRFRDSADRCPDESFLGAEGLQKFNLGMTPASVTPPPTWRRAAWFTVAASGAALGGLILASSAMVGYSRSPRDWNLPQEPSQQGASPPGTADLPSAPRFPVAATPQGTPLDGGVGVGARQPARLPMVGGVVPHQVSGPPAEIPRVHPRPPSSSGTEAVRRRCDQYFTALQNGDLRGAYAMTADTLRAAGFAAFTVRYAAASSIDVTEATVEPGRIVTSVRITWADGTVEPQRRELLLSPGENPTILADDRIL